MTVPHNVRGRGRHYTHPATGDELPSVTNIIGVLDKPALPRWAALEVAKAAAQMKTSLENLDDDDIVDMLKGAPWRKSGRAAERGTNIHGWIEQATTGGTIPSLHGEAKGYQQAASKWVREFRPEVIHSEVTVFSSRWGYAGTFDFIAKMPDGQTVLGDYKTSKAVYPEVALQLAACRHADEMEVDGKLRAMIPVDDTLVVRIGLGGDLEVRRVDTSPDIFRAFVACLEAWKFKFETSPIGGVYEPTA